MKLIVCILCMSVLAVVAQTLKLYGLKKALLYCIICFLVVEKSSSTTSDDVFDSLKGITVY